MKPFLKTYVTFTFSPAFILESKGREQHLVEEEKTTALKPGTLERVVSQYTEVEVLSRDLSALKVPKGALHFSFYDRLATFVRWKDEEVPLYSEPLDQSGLYFMENEGEFFHRYGLESGKDTRLPSPWRKQLLELMDQYNSTRIFKVQNGGEVEENFILGENDSLVRPENVQIIDTEIPWKRKLVLLTDEEPTSN